MPNQSSPRCSLFHFWLNCAAFIGCLIVAFYCAIVGSSQAMTFLFVALIFYAELKGTTVGKLPYLQGAQVTV
jgi:hypothetical protein